MGLIDGGQAVHVHVDAWGTDSDGNRVRRPEGAAVPVTGRWSYGFSSEDQADGQVTGSQATFLCRDFPAGFAGRVEFDGRDWDVVGDPTFHGLSAATLHWRVQLRARASRPAA